MRLSFRCLALILLLSFHSIGQTINTAPHLFFEQPYALQRADLSSVTCIFKDSRHIMWFGTENGLYRYDGVNLKSFGHHNGDTTSLPSSVVEQIAEAKNGHLWVALQMGIAEINPDNLKCKIYYAANHKLDVNNYTNKICIDEADNIWVGNNLGIFLFDKKKQIFNNVWHNKMEGDSLSKYVTSIVNINNHLVAASTFHTIVLLNKVNNSFKQIPLFTSVPPKDSSITSILLDSKQNLWIGSWGGGIYNYNLANDKLSRVNALQAIYNIPHFYITSFYETILEKQRIIWVSTSVGLLKCSVNNNGSIADFSFISHDKDDEHSILPDNLTSSYFDSDGALWCGGENGICKCFPFQDNFKFFNGLKGLVLDIQPLKINNATRYFINSWNSISGTGLSVTDSNGRQVYENVNPHFTDKDDGKNISGEAIDKYNRIWISSMAGVSVLDEKFNIIHQWNKNTSGENNLTYHRTSGIIIHNDTVWVICYHRGIDLFDLSFKKIRHYTAGETTGMIDNFISAFFNDSKGNLWICGNSELYGYIPGKTGFKAYRLSPEPGSCGPRDIAETKSGDLIIASVAGLIRFNPSTEKYTYISSDLLEKEQSISSAAVDRNGEVWFLTDKHLVHYKPDENRFTLFGQEDGLDVSRGLNELRTFNGTDFYLCQYDQVIKFNCDSLSHPVTPPYLFVDMQANDSNVYSNSNLGELFLPYNKNKLQFEFTGVSYIKAAQNQYYYQLSDVDKQWNITYKNSVSYANLSPGNYTFKVKTVNYAGIWSEDKIIHFIITPPYWKTWWFTILSVITILSILFFIIRYITQRNLKEKILKLEKETAVEKERNRIAQDMHDDLGSGLTKIAILSEVVKKQMDQPEKAFEQLGHISDSSRTLVDNLQDIIWMLNTKHDKLESLAVYIREYATKFFEQSGVSVSFDYPEQIEPVKIGEEQRRNFYMAIKEALNNVIKHAEANTVKMVFKVQKNMVTFAVTDDGKGFNTNETRKFANGVKNMQARMEQAHGTCNILSEPGKGTCITFALSL